MRHPILEGEYEVETISLLADSGHDSHKVLDRIDVILDWLSSISGRHLRRYKKNVRGMLSDIKEILKLYG